MWDVMAKKCGKRIFLAKIIWEVGFDGSKKCGKWDFFTKKCGK